MPESRRASLASSVREVDFTSLLASAKDCMRRTTDIQTEHAAVLAQLSTERRAREAMEAQCMNNFEELQRALSTEKIPASGLAAVLQKYRQRVTELDSQLCDEVGRRQCAETEAAAAIRAKDAMEERSLQLQGELEQLRQVLAETQARADAESGISIALRREVEELRKLLAAAQHQQEEARQAAEEAASAYAVELAQARAERQSLNDSLLAARELMHQHEVALEAARAEVRVKVERVRALKAAVVALEEQLRSAEVLASVAQRRAEEASVAARAAIESENAIRAEATAAREQAETARAEVVLLQARFTEIERQLQETTARSADALAEEREKRARTRKDADAAREAYSMEKALREKIAAELFAEIDARKEAERRQAYALAALHEQVKRQIAAIVELDEALKQEALLRTRLEEQLEAERLARTKAEDALCKLDQIFRSAGSADADWEIVDEEDGEQTKLTVARSGGDGTQ